MYVHVPFSLQILWGFVGMNPTCIDIASFIGLI